MSEERHRLKIADSPRDAWHIAAVCLHALDGWDWDGLIKARADADTFGHIMDPTGYRALLHDKNAARNMELAKGIAALLRAAKETHPELFDASPSPGGER